MIYFRIEMGNKKSKRGKKGGMSRKEGSKGRDSGIAIAVEEPVEEVADGHQLLASFSELGEDVQDAHVVEVEQPRDDSGVGTLSFLEGDSSDSVEKLRRATQVMEDVPTSNSLGWNDASSPLRKIDEEDEEQVNGIAVSTAVGLDDTVTFSPAILSVIDEESSSLLDNFEVEDEEVQAVNDLDEDEERVNVIALSTTVGLDDAPAREDQVLPVIEDDAPASQPLDNLEVDPQVAGGARSMELGARPKSVPSWQRKQEDGQLRPCLVRVSKPRSECPYACHICPKIYTSAGWLRRHMLTKHPEKSGSSLRGKFPLTRLWDGQMCGRDNCIPCHQGAEDIQPCNKANLVYENICLRCNPDAKKKGPLKKYDPTIPSIYVGESGRSLQERYWRSMMTLRKTRIPSRKAWRKSVKYGRRRLQRGERS